MSKITTLEAIRQASEASKEYTDKQIDKTVNPVKERMSRLEDTLIDYTSVTGQSINVPTNVSPWATLDRLEIGCRVYRSEFEYDLETSGDCTAELRDGHTVSIRASYPSEEGTKNDVSVKLFDLPEGTWELRCVRQSTGIGRICAGDIEIQIPHDNAGRYRGEYCTYTDVTVTGPCEVSFKVSLSYNKYYVVAHSWCGVFATRKDAPSGRPYVYDVLEQPSYTRLLTAFTGVQDPDGNWEKYSVAPDLNDVAGIRDSIVEYGTTYAFVKSCNYVDFATMEFVKRNSHNKITEEYLSDAYLYKTSDGAVVYAFPKLHDMGLPNGGGIEGFRPYSMYSKQNYSYPWCYDSSPGGYLEMVLISFPLGTSLEAACDILVGRDLRRVHRETRTDISKYFQDATQARSAGAYVISVKDIEMLTIEYSPDESRYQLEPLRYVVTFAKPKEVSYDI